MSDTEEYPDPKKYPHDYYLVHLYASDLACYECQIITREFFLEETFKPWQIIYGGCCWRECADYFQEKYGYEYGS